MHIPDGFLDTRTWVTLTAVSGGTLAVALRKVRAEYLEHHVPLMGVTAAFVFTAQMINIPIMAGTSGHFMGGTLAAILLGPLSGLIVMAAVLLAQCLLFQDGGLTALGANFFNMAIIGCCGGYALYSLGKRLVPVRQTLCAAGAAYLALILSATACGAEIAVSGRASWVVIVPSMAGIHAIIGFLEGSITFLVIQAVNRMRPDVLAWAKI